MPAVISGAPASSSSSSTHVGPSPAVGPSKKLAVGLPPPRFVKVSGCEGFRHTLVVASLSCTPVEISGIREGGSPPGLREYEGNFLKLLHRLTNGAKIVIDPTGTCVRYSPGALIGGTFTHDCNLARGLGYWLEPLALLAPFCKSPVEVTLTGVTNREPDLGVDAFRTVTVPLLKRFGVEASLRVLGRGCTPLGGGSVLFRCQTLRKLTPVQLVQQGKIRRIRGLAYSARVAPDRGNRVVFAAKGVLLNFLPDVFITSEHFTGAEAGESPGYGITLVAESTSGQVFMSEEASSDPSEIESQQLTPEDLGARAAKQLLEQIVLGGCVDTAHQPMALLLLALCPEQLSYVHVGQLTHQAERMQSLLEEHFGVKFSTTRQRRKDLPSTMLVGCVGANLVNLTKRSA